MRWWRCNQGFLPDWGIEVAGGRDDGADGYTVGAAVWVPLSDAWV